MTSPWPHRSQVVSVDDLGINSQEDAILLFRNLTHVIFA